MGEWIPLGRTRLTHLCKWRTAELPRNEERQWPHCRSPLALFPFLAWWSVACLLPPLHCRSAPCWQGPHALNRHPPLLRSDRGASSPQALVAATASSSSSASSTGGQTSFSCKLPSPWQPPRKGGHYLGGCRLTDDERRAASAERTSSEDKWLPRCLLPLSDCCSGMPRQRVGVGGGSVGVGLGGGEVWRGVISFRPPAIACTHLAPVVQRPYLGTMV